MKLKLHLIWDFVKAPTSEFVIILQHISNLNKHIHIYNDISVNRAVSIGIKNEKWTYHQLGLFLSCTSRVQCPARRIIGHFGDELGL